MSSSCTALPCTAWLAERLNLAIGVQSKPRAAHHSRVGCKRGEKLGVHTGPEAAAFHLASAGLSPMDMHLHDPARRGQACQHMSSPSLGRLDTLTCLHSQRQ